MRTRSRRIHWSTRRLLLAACLCGPTFASSSTHCTGAETPANQFRIVTPPTKQAVLGQVQLASDGWAPRQSIGSTEKNSNKVVHTGNEEQVGSNVADAQGTLELTEPKSTLNFIIPSIKRAEEKPAVPLTEKPQATANATQAPMSSDRLASELYGPGSHPVSPKKRVSDELAMDRPAETATMQQPHSTVRDDRQSPAMEVDEPVSRDTASSEADVANPEQNEPYYAPDTLIPQLI